MSVCHNVGFGFDSHLFSKTGTLVLGGVLFKGTPALKGHSDGDALLHAVIDALLGASGLGDIGQMFPDTSLKYKGVSSLLLLEEASKKIREKGYHPGHIDITILADKPRLAPVTETIKKKIGRTLEISRSAINIKAKTQEGLTLFKSPGGIAVWAVATLRIGD